MLPVCIAIDCFKFLGHEIGDCSWLYGAYQELVIQSSARVNCFMML